MSKKKKKKTHHAQDLGKKKKATGQSPCALTLGHFCQLRKNASPPSFHPILEGSGTKHPVPTHLFPSPPSNQSSTKNVLSFFYFPFSLKSTQPNTPLLCFSLSLLNYTFHGSSLSMCLCLNLTSPNGQMAFFASTFSSSPRCIPHAQSHVP